MKNEKKIEFPDSVLWDIDRAANAIAPDLMECEDIDNEALVESILDADNVLTFGDSETGAASNNFLKALYKEYGFSNVVKAVLATGRCNFI